MIAINRSYVGNRCDTQEVNDFIARGFVEVPFKVGKPMSSLKSSNSWRKAKLQDAMFLIQA